MKHPGNQPQVRACFTLSFLLAAGLHLFSQGFTLEGRVTDKETGAPVPFVTVYINGTTLGTITGPGGEFRIERVILPAELIISHVAYQLDNIPLNDPVTLTGLTLRIQRKIVELEEATVVHANLREEYLHRFKNWFLGAGHEASGAEILNDSIIRIIPGEEQEFSASAPAPILVRLPATGYLVKVDLVRFDIRYREDWKGYQGSFLGYYYFESMEAASETERRARERTRATTYYNSSMHFCRSLYHNRLLENGYQFERICVPERPGTDRSSPLPDFSASYDSDAFGNPMLLLTRFACTEFLIKYSYRGRNRPADLTYLQSNPMRIHLSGLVFLKDTVALYPSGRIPDNSIMFSGVIGQKGVASMLPEDYIPSMR